MSQMILQTVVEGGARASHVTFGARGTGIPARIQGGTKENQVVISLDPERLYIQRERSSCR